MYFVFLAYYSYVILFAFRPTITVAEWIVIVWIATMLVEEVRQVNLQAGGKLYTVEQGDMSVRKKWVS